MSKIHYVEVICQNETTAEIIDEQRGLNLQQFAQVCGQSPEWVLQLIDYDILLVGHPDQHQFWERMSHGRAEPIVCNVTLMPVYRRWH